MGGTVLGERPPRRNDIDWLRIAAVLLLIPYHTARCFNWDEDFYVKNDPPWQPAQRFVEFVNPWQMSLLFLLAGASTWLAFRHRGPGEYVGERAKRLLIPFVFGLIVIVPPQTWWGYHVARQGRHLVLGLLPEVLDDGGRERRGLSGRLLPRAALVHPLPVRVLARRAADLPLAEEPRERQSRRARPWTAVAGPRPAPAGARADPRPAVAREGRRYERAAVDRLSSSSSSSASCCSPTSASAV